MTLKNEKLIRFLKEWGIFAIVVSVLYFTGLHTEIAGGLQRLMLMTGWMDASEKIEVAHQISTNYEMVLEDETGKTVHLSDLKNQVIFINFWATWCPPCRAEMPEIQALYHKKKKDVSFLLISLDKDFEKAKKFVQDKAFDFPIYRLKNALPTEFESRSIPATFVISAQGKIIFEHQGIADYHNEAFIKLLEQAKIRQ